MVSGLFKMSDNFASLKKLLAQHAQASSYNAQMFFKTEPGSYGAHDKFLGIKNPVLRALAKQFKDISYEEIVELLKSEYNEERLLALFFLVDHYDRGDRLEKEKVFELYVQHMDQVNNWNLVDCSAYCIVGAHTYAGFASSDFLYELIGSKSLWRRRIGMVSTWFFIRKSSTELTMQLAAKLLKDQHDLMHKAVGWMLREAGKKDESALRLFLDQHAKSMPRTMLRYALEKFPEQDRKKYMA